MKNDFFSNVQFGYYTYAANNLEIIVGGYRLYLPSQDMHDVWYALISGGQKAGLIVLKKKVRALWKYNVDRDYAILAIVNTEEWKFLHIGLCALRYNLDDKKSVYSRLKRTVFESAYEIEKGDFLISGSTKLSTETHAMDGVSNRIRMITYRQAGMRSAEIVFVKMKGAN